MPISNTTPFIKELQILTDKISDQTEQAVQQIGERGAQLARDTKLFHNDGPLKQATEFRKATAFAGYVIADKPYAYWLEEGNNQQGPFIKPVFAKALHFFINGHEVFAKKVKSHPPLPFMAQARDQLEKEAIQIIQQHLSLAIK